MDATASQLDLSFVAEGSATRVALDTVVLMLKRRKLSGNIPCAKATAQLLLKIIGNCNFPSTYLMMEGVKSIGKLLSSVAPAELTIGNIVRRVLFCIREEYSSQLRTEQNSIANNSTVETVHKMTQRRSRSNSTTSTGSTGSTDNHERDNAVNNLTSGLASLITPHPSRNGRTESNEANNRPLSPGSPLKRVDTLSEQIKAANLLLDPNQQPSLVLTLGDAFGSSNMLNKKLEHCFPKYFGNMRQNVIQSVNDLIFEIDNYIEPIEKEAKDHIHADECILVYGYSQTVENFLKGAAKKRKYQLIIAEGGSSLDGYKLAASLSTQDTNNISITLIPDSGIYAIMCRVNKVIISPHAVMMDGGSICTSGHLMVATAAKEFSVPVVSITGVFTLTPLFAHNQALALGELISPASVIAYDSPNICFENIEVIIHAYEFIPPDLISIYVTNNGSHQPSYIYKLLSEFYHHQDYTM